MTTKPALTAIVASYVSSEDAANDLKSLDDYYWSAAVDGFDAVLLVTDAWNQPHVQARTGRSLEDVSLGPIHEAFASLFGGPFIAGKLPAPPLDERVSEASLRRLGLALPANTVLIVAFGFVEDPSRVGEPFGRAQSVQSQPFHESQMAELPSIVRSLIAAGQLAEKSQTPGGAPAGRGSSR